MKKVRAEIAKVERELLLIEAQIQQDPDDVDLRAQHAALRRYSYQLQTGHPVRDGGWRGGMLGHGAGEADGKDVLQERLQLDVRAAQAGTKAALASKKAGLTGRSDANFVPISGWYAKFRAQKVHTRRRTTLHRAHPKYFC